MRILVGVGGGISAYKTAELVSGLVRAGHEVTVAMTEAATRFVTPTTFASLTRRPVLVNMFPDAGSTGGDALFPHLYPAMNADMILIASDSVFPFLYGRSTAVSASKMSAIAIMRASGLISLPCSRLG